MNLESKTEKVKSDEELIASAEDFKGLVMKGNYEGAREYWENMSDQGRDYIMQTPKYNACRKPLNTSRI